jgi:hypothetical protein
MNITPWPEIQRISEARLAFITGECLPPLAPRAAPLFDALPLEYPRKQVATIRPARQRGQSATIQNGLPDWHRKDVQHRALSSRGQDRCELAGSGEVLGSR